MSSRLILLKIKYSTWYILIFHTNNVSPRNGFVVGQHRRCCESCDCKPNFWNFAFWSTSCLQKRLDTNKMFRSRYSRRWGIPSSEVGSCQCRRRVECCHAGLEPRRPSSGRYAGHLKLLGICRKLLPHERGNSVWEHGRKPVRWYHCLCEC